jgi:putative glutamine amidotransferase
MARQTRPCIGINADLLPAGKLSGASLRLPLGYIDAVTAAGGLPVIVPPCSPEVDPEVYLDRLDGFVLSGASADLDPRKHGLPSHPAVQPLPPRRDEGDRLLVRRLVERRMPILAIGLGMQQINVALGGTLFLHLPEEFPRGLSHRDPADATHRHMAAIAPGSRFEEYYGPGEIRINSQHHQAVRQPGKGLRVAARAADGVVEAIEAIDPDWFCLGVQWHPEAESATALDLQLFECLVQASARGQAVLHAMA